MTIAAARARRGAPLSALAGPAGGGQGGRSRASRFWIGSATGGRPSPSHMGPHPVHARGTAQRRANVTRKGLSRCARAANAPREAASRRSGSTCDPGRCRRTGPGKKRSPGRSCRSLSVARSDPNGEIVKFLMIYEAIPGAAPPSPETLARLGTYTEKMMSSGTVVMTGGIVPPSRGIKM